MRHHTLALQVQRLTASAGHLPRLCTGKMAPTVDTVGLRSGAGPDSEVVTDETGAASFTTTLTDVTWTGIYAAPALSLLDSMYPHFNANPPPPAVHVSFNEPVSPSASYGRDDGSFEDSAVGGKYGGGEGGQSHALGPIREHPDEEEHMHEDAEEEGHDRRGQGTRLGARVPAGNHPPPPETFDPHQQHLYQSPDSYGERFADRAAPAASQLQPSHTRIPSDPRDSYYNDHHRPRAGLGAPGNLGARHLSTIDERGSVYSQQTAGYV